jgi:hypothetical protein
VASPRAGELAAFRFAGTIKIEIDLAPTTVAAADAEKLRKTNALIRLA